MLERVVDASKYDSNLILYSQLCDSKITYIDNKNVMILV